MPPRAACSHGYAQWRCLTFRQLYDESPCTATIQLPFLHPKTLNDRKHLKRRYHASTKRCYKDKTSEADHFGPFHGKPLSELGNTQRGYRVVWSDKTGEKNECNDHDESGKPQSKSKSRVWKPTSQQGVQDLSALAESLRALSEKTKAGGSRPSDHKQTHSESDDHGLSISPLEVLNDSKKRKPKRSPTKEELATLKHNPWAKMLGAPLRICMASRSRFPKPLMLDIGQVVNPNDLEVYLMPDAIADLQAFNRRLQTGNMNDAITSRGGTGDKLQMLPYKLLFEKLTDTFMALDSKTKQAKTRSGAVSKVLFPTRWSQNAQKISAYQNASKDYYAAAEKQGLDDEIHKRPSPVYDSDKIQWQPAIVERIPNIMRQRILLCLNRMADIDQKRKNRNWKHLLRFRSLTEVESDASIAGSLLRPASEMDFWNDMGDIEAEGAISGTSQGQGARQDGRPPIAVRPSEIETQEPPSQITARNPQDWIPGSFFLHIGPPGSIYTQLTSDDTPAIDDARRQQADSAELGKYIPPMVNIAGAYRLPVFNLHAMLGIQFVEVLSLLLQRHRILEPDSTAASGYTTLASNTEFLVLVKSTAPCAFFLIQELWQLWRYLGGTDCLIQEHPEAKPRRTKVDMSHNMPPEAWKQLYQILGLPFSGSPLSEGSQSTVDSAKDG
ncbi:hypothetical protein H2198_009961 [Neophaeococcomyces mojaviensis]|uniref:Uncharacterized protein n=1 Tax=Neophaeococcomyces mojaviensis TaxID=3383035 RepID=A0ACC2ZT34_9EURO|nr:hypothetical protein H2198_009961 [Knufia sp. JES_112]